MTIAQREYRRLGASGIPRILKQWAVPVGIAPSGSIGNNGALTLGTALPSAYPGIWLHFPAGAVSTGSVAGLYWCVMSTTTAGTIYNTVLDPLTQVPYRPASNVPLVTTGPGAYTGVIAVVTVATVIVPGGSMRRNGRVTVQHLRSHNNSAGNKSSDIKWGATSMGFWNTNALGAGFQCEIANSDNTQRQILSPWGESNVRGPLARPALLAAENTDSDVLLRFFLQIPTATDVAVLDTASVTITPAD